MSLSGALRSVRIAKPRLRKFVAGTLTSAVAQGLSFAIHDARANRNPEAAQRLICEASGWHRETHTAPGPVSARDIALRLV
jgi:hypothetical protein